MRNKGLLITGWVTSSVVFVGSARADLVLGAMFIQTDTTEDFLAEGAFTSADQGNNGPLGEFFLLDGTNWDFDIAHFAASWNRAGVSGAKIAIKGRHFIPPHGEGINNLTANGQPFDAGGTPFFSEIHNYDFDESKSYTIRKSLNHGQHVDNFTMTATAKATSGTMNLLSGPAKVTAQHRKTKKSSTPTGKTMGAPGSVSFDAPSETLSFSIGPITILDSVGGMSGGIEPQYLDDPIASAAWTVTDLRLVGVQPDGRFKFGAGTMTVSDPAGQFSFVGEFGEYFIDETTNADPLTSFGLLNSILISDVGDPEDGPSIFLRDFVDTNMFGIGIPSEEWALIQGIDFAFTTDVDLAMLTAGFTSSASTSALFLTTANMIPAPGPLALLGLGGLVAARRRRQRRPKDISGQPPI